MTQIKRDAERCLIAISVSLSMMSDRNPNFALFCGMLADVSPDCDQCAEALIPLRVAAEDLVAAGAPDVKHRAISRLTYEVRAYFLLAAADQWDALKVGRGRP